MNEYLMEVDVWDRSEAMYTRRVVVEVDPRDDPTLIGAQIVGATIPADHMVVDVRIILSE